MMTKEERERKAQEYVDKMLAVNKENALRDMRTSIDLFLTKDGKFYSTLANEYRDKIAEYGIYCREEELGRWLSMTQYLIDSIKNMTDNEWLYDAWTIEATCRLMEAMDENIDWDEIHKIVEEQGHTGGSISEVAQLLLAYSPHGIAFVDHIIKPRTIYNGMTNLKNAYNSEKGRLARQEIKQKKALGARLIKCLSVQMNSIQES